MRKIREVLRLRWAVGMSNRRIAASCGVSRPTVSKYLRRAESAGLSWPLPSDASDARLERLLFPPPPDLPASARGVPDFAEVHRQLKRKGVTLFLLWQEYRTASPNGYQYSWFCERYRAWQGKLDVVMRQDHGAGEKLFVDYARRGRPSGSSTGPRVSFARRRSSSRSWTRPTTPMPRPPGPRACPTGSALTCASLRLSMLM